MDATAASNLAMGLAMGLGAIGPGIRRDDSIAERRPRKASQHRVDSGVVVLAHGEVPHGSYGSKKSRVLRQDSVEHRPRLDTRPTA